MANIYGVTFKDKGKVYYFDGKDLSLNTEDMVIVETERGEQFGKIICKISPEDATGNYKDIIRVSTKKDFDMYLANLKDAKSALNKARLLADELGLTMNFIEASYTFDRRQLLLNFLADERVDFRELARRLAGIYKTRIELRQIGVRDKAKEVGGVGMCGRELCCSKFLNHIDSITMNMAKNQNIPLNPTKINGSCGRLLCCLTYEDDEYTCCARGLPRVGDTAKCDIGVGRVISVDILNRKYKVNVDGEKCEVGLEPISKPQNKKVKP